MAKYGSPSIFFLVDGFNLLAAKIQGLRYKRKAITEPSDGAGDSWKEHTPTGDQEAEFAQEGAFFDTSVGNIHAAMSGSVPSTPQAVVRVVCAGFAGNVAGRPFVGLEGAYNHGYEVLGERNKLQRANAEYTVSGKIEDGVVLHPLGVETADANTEGASSVDHTTETDQKVIPIVSSSVANPSLITTTVPHGRVTGDTVLISGHAGSTPSINAEHTITVVSPTTFTIPVNVTVGGTGGTLVAGQTNAGGAAYLQMTALALGGHTGALVTIRDSADDITYADLVAFTSRTTIGAERKTIAGAVRRHLAQSIDFTGAGSPSSAYFAGFARY